MYWQTITSHCSPPFPGYCWTKKKSQYELLQNSADDFPSHLPFLSFHQLFFHARTFFLIPLILKLQCKYNKLCKGKKTKICQTGYAHKHLTCYMVSADFWNAEFLKEIKKCQIFDFFKWSGRYWQGISKPSWSVQMSFSSSKSFTL